MTAKILVADDDLDNRTIAQETLLSSDYDVRLAVNGLEVLQIAPVEKPDLILLDLSMPKLDGWQTLRQLKADPSLARIPVIAFTAHAMRGDEEKAREAGCDDFLTKPCAPKKLLAKVRQWLAERQTEVG